MLPVIRTLSFGSATCLLISIRGEPEKRGNYMKFNQIERHFFAKRKQLARLSREMSMELG